MQSLSAEPKLVMGTYDGPHDLAAWKLIHFISTFSGAMCESALSASMSPCLPSPSPSGSSIASSGCILRLIDAMIAALTICQSSPSTRCGAARHHVVGPDVHHTATDGDRGVDRHVEILDDLEDGERLLVPCVHAAQVDRVRLRAVDQLAQDDAVLACVEEVHRLGIDR